MQTVLWLEIQNWLQPWILGKFRCQEKGGLCTNSSPLQSYGTFKQVKPQALAGCLYFCFVFVATQSWTIPWVLCESGLTKQTLIKKKKKKKSGSHRGLVCFHKALIHHQTEWLCSAKWPEIPVHWPPSYWEGCKVSHSYDKVAHLTLTVRQGIPELGRQPLFGSRVCLPAEWSLICGEWHCPAMRLWTPVVQKKTGQHNNHTRLLKSLNIKS